MYLNWQCYTKLSFVFLVDSLLGSLFFFFIEIYIFTCELIFHWDDFSAGIQLLGCR